MTTLENINIGSMVTKPGGNVNEVKADATSGQMQQRQQFATSGQSVPVEAIKDQESGSKKKDLDQAVKYVSNYVQNITRELNFTVDEDSGRNVVTVLDQTTGDVIRQIPNEEMIELAQTLSELKDVRAEGILFQGDA